MKTIRRLQIICLIAMGCLLSDPHVMAQGDSAFRVKAANILSITVPAGPEDEIADFELQVTLDGETFFPLEVGLPRPWRLFHSVEYNEAQVTIRVVVVGDLPCNQGAFFPEKPETYQFRWVIRLNSVNNEPLMLDQSYRFGPPSKADLAFVQKAADPALLRRLFGQDWFERQGEGTKNRLLSAQGADARAIEVIARLVEATRAKEPIGAHGPDAKPQTGIAWADALWDLAQQLPESSYAPYAAFYAGSVYAGLASQDERWQKQAHGLEKPVLDEDEAREIRSRVQAHPTYGKGEVALQAAANNGDDYLRPRALYMLAMHKEVGLDLDGAERVVDELAAAAPGRGTISELVDRRRKDIAHRRKSIVRDDR